MSIYDDQLGIIGERIETISRNLAETEREQHSRETSTAATAFRTLPKCLRITPGNRANGRTLAKRGIVHVEA